MNYTVRKKKTCVVAGIGVTSQHIYLVLHADGRIAAV